MALTVDIGDVVKLTAAFDQSGTAVDPGQVKVKIENPYGVETTYTYGTDAALVKVSTGNYMLEYAPNKAGRWRWRWEGNVSNKAAEEGEFFVRESAFV